MSRTLTSTLGALLAKGFGVGRFPLAPDVLAHRSLGEGPIARETVAASLLPAPTRHVVAQAKIGRSAKAGGKRGVSLHKTCAVRRPQGDGYSFSRVTGKFSRLAE
jgi:hypothetical protein